MQPKVAHYRQLWEILRGQIFDGTFPPGERLPSEPQLQERYGITRPVVSEAIKMLAREGLVRTEHGRGTTVLERHRYAVALTAAGQPGKRELRRAVSAFEAAAGADPAIGPIAVGITAGGLQLRAVIEAAHQAHALAAVIAAAPEGWDWAGAIAAVSPV